MRTLVMARGVTHLVAPVRPSRKASYPLISIEAYCAWRSDRQEMFDPGLRAHRRVGGKALHPCHESMMEASVGEWTAWTELRFPAAGDYIPGGHVPLAVSGGRGRYREPGVWLLHSFAWAAPTAVVAAVDAVRRRFPARIGRMTAAIDVPERFNAAAHFLDRHVGDGRGGRTAFRFAGRTVTYEEVALRANRLGNALLARGVQMEQRVLLALPDRPEFAEAFWGAMKIGAVPVPVSDGLPAEELAFMLQDSRARGMVASETAAGTILPMRARCPSLEAVIAVGGRPRGALEYERLLERASPELTAADTSRDDVALWGYTSGSTGRPKAAVHLHHDLVHAAELVGRGTFGIGPDDLIFSASKLHFAFGLGNSLYFPALVGAASLLVPERLEPERVFELIEAERPTVLFAVATMYRRLLQVDGAERRFDLSSLRLCVSSGEALPPGLFHGWKSRFGHELLDVVGSTEALHDYLANRPGEARPGSSGRVIPGYEARLVDDEGRPVAPGMVGQLLIKGDSTAAYYWNRHERTKATMLGDWLRTGDMFYQDTDGYFYFCGRADDMLKVGGMWVSPVEVEACLTEHPAVLEVAVVGRGDVDGLTKPHAYCVLRDGRAGSDALATELRESVRKRLGGYKSPRWIDFVAELPKTTTGKIQRFALRRR